MKRSAAVNLNLYKQEDYVNELDRENLLTADDMGDDSYMYIFEMYVLVCACLACPLQHNIHSVRTVCVEY